MASVLQALKKSILIWIFSPFYLVLFPCGSYYEQLWLDAAIAHLGELRQICDDPDLCEVLDYTMARYNKVGKFHVQVQYCLRFNPYLVPNAYNSPFAPGLTLDYSVLDMPLEEGSLILAHEALHDYYPFFGHSHITPRMERLRHAQVNLR
jgi:hypothetical protein